MSLWASAREQDVALAPLQHRAPVHAVAWSPDGKSVVTAS